METSRKNVFSTNLILLFFSTILSLLIGELVARNFAVVRNVGPSFTEYHPVYGKWHKKNISCERFTPEFEMHLSTNSLGCRGPEPGRFPERGVLFLGDSFTEGYGVNNEEAYPELVRRVLMQQYGKDSVPVVNAGMGDLGNGLWLKFLRHEGKRFNPRLVVLQISDNDFTDNLHEKMFSLNEKDSLIEYPVAAPGSSRIIQNVLEAIPGISYSYLAGLLKQALWSSVRPPRSAVDGQPGPADQLTYRLVDEILTLCERERWPVLVLAVGIEPSRFERMQQLVRKHRMQFIKTPAFNQRPELFYSYDGHWRANGHEFVASQVLDAITVSGVLEQSPQTPVGQASRSSN